MSDVTVALQNESAPRSRFQISPDERNMRLMLRPNAKRKTAPQKLDFATQLIVTVPQPEIAGDRSELAR
jgi:hypothetical protein